MLQNNKIIDFLSQETGEKVVLENTNYTASLGNVSKIIISGTSYILKKHKKSRTTSDIKFENDLISQYRSHHLPVVWLLQIGKNNFFQINDDFYSIYESAVGVQKKYFNVSQAEKLSLANTISLMHKATLNYKPKHEKRRRDLFTFNFDDYILPIMANEPYYRYLKEDIAHLKNLLMPKIKIFPTQAIHNDLSLINIFFQDEKVSCIIDFDDCCVGTRISDITNALFDFTFDEKGIIYQSPIALINEFKIRENLIDSELALLPALFLHRLIICILFFYKYRTEEPNTYYSQKLKIYLNHYLKVRKDIT